MIKQIIRKRNGKFFKLMDARITNYNGVLIKDSYWLECFENGEIGDGDKNGKIENHTIHCKIPKGKTDIDLSTLSEDCLEG